MAVFAKNSLTQVSGFDNPIIAGEWYYDNADKTLKEIPPYIPPEPIEAIEPTK